MYSKSQSPLPLCKKLAGLSKHKHAGSCKHHTFPLHEDILQGLATSKACISYLCKPRYPCLVYLKFPKKKALRRFSWSNSFAFFQSPKSIPLLIHRFISLHKATFTGGKSSWSLRLVRVSMDNSPHGHATVSKTHSISPPAWAPKSSPCYCNAEHSWPSWADTAPPESVLREPSRLKIFLKKKNNPTSFPAWFSMCSQQANVAVQVKWEHGIGNYCWRWGGWQRVSYLKWPQKENLWYHRKLPAPQEATMIRRLQAKSPCLQPSTPKRSEGKTVQQVNRGGQRVLSMSHICGLFPKKSFFSSVPLTPHRAHNLHFRSALSGMGRWPND